MNLENQKEKALKEIHLLLNSVFDNELKSNQDLIKEYIDEWKGDEHRAMDMFKGTIFPNLTNLLLITFQHKNLASYSKVNLSTFL